MALKKGCTLLFIFWSIVCAQLPFDGTKASLDFDIGLCGVSPFSFHHSGRNAGSVFEVAAAALYEYGFRGESQLYSASMGGVYNSERLSLSGAVTMLEAFNLYREVTPRIGCGFNIGKKNCLAFFIAPTIHSIPGEKKSSFSGALNIAHKRKIITFAGRAQFWGMEKGEELTRADVRLALSTGEHKLGAQAVALSLERSSHVVALTIVEQYRLNRFVLISAGVQSRPLFVHVGLVLSKGKVEVGSLFSRHSELGWSRGGYLQFRMQSEE